jgi:hypothetical protein
MHEKNPYAPPQSPLHTSRLVRNVALGTFTFVVGPPAIYWINSLYMEFGRYLLSLVI